MILNYRSIVYGILFIFLLYVLFAHDPGGGGGGHGHGGDKGPPRK